MLLDCGLDFVTFLKSSFLNLLPLLLLLFNVNEASNMLYICYK